MISSSITSEHLCRFPSPPPAAAPNTVRLLSATIQLHSIEAEDGESCYVVLIPGGVPMPWLGYLEWSTSERSVVEMVEDGGRQKRTSAQLQSSAYNCPTLYK